MGRMPWLRMALPVQRLLLAPRDLVSSLPPISLLKHNPSLSRSKHIQIYSRIAASLDASVPHQHSRSLSTDLDTEGRESSSVNYEAAADYSAWKRDSSGPEIANKSEAPVVDWLRLTERDLLMHCKLDTFRASGPGGQHRNKTESAVRIRHLPTALVAQASEDRSQHNNRVVALNRLRQLIAIEVRRPVELEGYKAPHELMRILPSSPKARRDLQRIGSNHPDFVLGLQALLDLLSTVKGSISECAALLEISTGALSRLIFSDRFLWTAVNNLRASHKLKPLRGD